MAGQRYHERMGTAIATCGKQKRSFFGFLKAAIDANLDGNQSAFFARAVNGYSKTNLRVAVTIRITGDHRNPEIAYPQIHKHERVARAGKVGH